MYRTGVFILICLIQRVPLKESCFIDINIILGPVLDESLKFENLKNFELLEMSNYDFSCLSIFLSLWLFKQYRKKYFFKNYGREIDRKLVSSRGNGQTWFVRMAGTRSHKLCGHYLVQVRQQTPIINQAYTSLDVCMNSAKISARVLRKNQKKWVWYGRGSWAFSLKKRGQKSNTCLDIFLKIFFNYLSTS